MNLANFPVEVLELILCSFDISYAVVALWQCGDRLLTRKLTECVTLMDLRRDRGFRMKPPALLAQLPKLRELSIYSYHALYRSPLSWSKLVSALPPSLKVIRFICTDASVAFKNYAPGWTAALPSYVSTAYERGLSEMVDFSRLFPHLEELKIGDAYIGSGVSESDLPALPSTLTRLETSSIHLTEVCNALKFPRSLRSLLCYLDFPRCDTTDSSYLETWRHALPDLEELGRISQGCSDASWIPLTVKTMKDDFYAFDAHLARTLPPLLQSLTLNSIMVDNWYEILPKCLTTLQFAGPINFIPYLPETLTTLSSPWAFPCMDPRDLMTSEDASSIAGTHIWPANLTRLEVIKLYEDNSLLYKLKALPRALKTLGVDLTGVSALDCSILPPSLTDFYVLSNGAVELSNLPTSLTSLYGERLRLSQALIDTLPKSLRTLQFDPTFDPTFGPHWSPSNSLTQLKVDDWRREWMQSLPKLLESFSITNSLNGMKYASKEASDRIFKGLPTTLTYFSVSDDDRSDMENFNEVFSSDCFSSLPPALRTLSLLFNGPFPSAALRHLPKSLRILDMRMKTMTEEDAAFIPSRLTSLTLKGLNWLECPFIGDHWPLAAIEVSGASRNSEGWRRIGARRDRVLKLAQPE